MSKNPEFFWTKFNRISHGIVSHYLQSEWATSRRLPLVMSLLLQTAIGSGTEFGVSSYIIQFTWEKYRGELYFEISTGLINIGKLQLHYLHG